MFQSPMKSLSGVTLCAVLTLFLTGGAQPEASVEQGARSLSGILDKARNIDRLIGLDLKAAGLRPNSRISDATFVRRAYVSIAGRIPSVAETEKFLGSVSSQKRSRLIDELLASPAHASHMFNWWADLLRVRTRLTNRVSGAPYMHWLKQSLVDNKPYNEMVRELLAAEGSAHARDNGATGYYLRDRGMPEDNMANTVRVFLGTRIECAQCHDHPSDKWKQKDFFGMVAFTGGMQFVDRDRNQKDQRRLRAIAEEIRKEHGEQAYRQVRNRTIQAAVQGVGGNGTGLARLPHDYKYDDAKPNSLVEVKTIFGSSVDVDARPFPERSKRSSRRRKPGNPQRRRQQPTGRPVDSRAAYADWMTSHENPRFTTVISNRLWKLAMGVGLIEPVDDLKDDTKAQNPELMSYLEDMMVEQGYDMRQFLRVLFNTRTWQSEVAAEAPQGGKAFHFTGPSLRRFTSEQVWDSMLTLLLDDVDGTLAKPGEDAERVYASFERIVNSSDQELREYMVQVATGGRRGNSDAMRSMVSQRQKAERQKIDEEIRPLQRKLREARRRRDRKAQKEIQDEINEIRKQARNRYRRRGRGNQIARASEVQQPAQPGHFLREFGQSDRETIQGSNSDPTVPQALNLINGFVEKNVIGNRRSKLMREISEAGSSDERIRAAFLAVLTRRPTSSESAMWRADFRRDPEGATKDLIWTLVNTHEFRFVH